MAARSILAAMTAPRSTYTSVLIGLLIAAAALTGCAKKQQPNAQPTVSTVLGDSPSATPTATDQPSASPTGGGQNAPTYPSSAKSYAQSLLSAWGSKNFTRLDQLAIQSAVQQVKDNGYPDKNWTYISCSTPDSTYSECLFRNAHGDEVVVKMTTTQLGHPTAVTEALLSKTTYSNSAGDYVGAFIYAWQQGNTQRMTRLATSTVTNYFKGKTAPAAYSTNTEGTAGHTKVIITELGGSGGSWIFNVVNESLGKSHAISELCQPTCA